MTESNLSSKNESRLLAALQRYGTHADYCAMYKGPIEDGCNCGLFEAMGLAPDGKPLSGDGSQVETSARLTDLQCREVVHALEMRDWRGITLDDVRMFDQLIEDARSAQETSTSPRSLAEGANTAGRQHPSKVHDTGSNPVGDAITTENSRCPKCQSTDTSPLTFDVLECESCGHEFTPSVLNGKADSGKP